MRKRSVCGYSSALWFLPLFLQYPYTRKHGYSSPCSACMPIKKGFKQFIEQAARHLASDCSLSSIWKEDTSSDTTMSPQDELYRPSKSRACFQNAISKVLSGCFSRGYQPKSAHIVIKILNWFRGCRVGRKERHPSELLEIMKEHPDHNRISLNKGYRNR